MNVKSMLMSTMSASELGADKDFNMLSLAICENNRKLLIAEMRAVGSDETVMYTNEGSPLLTVRAGEVLYIFNC